MTRLKGREGKSPGEGEAEVVRLDYSKAFRHSPFNPAGVRAEPPTLRSAISN